MASKRKTLVLLDGNPAVLLNRVSAGFRRMAQLRLRLEWMMARAFVVKYHGASAPYVY